MKVAILCEYSGIVRDAFIDAGHDAISCDLLPSESNKGAHYQGDVFHFLSDRRYSLGFDLIIAHPPCTFLSNSGVRWLYNPDKSRNEQRWRDMGAAAIFFKSLLYSNANKICVENPIQHKHAKELIGVAPTQIIQPWQFGHTTSKATCLWLSGLPALLATRIIPKEERTQDVWLASPGPNRWKERSRTFTGIAKAMASQWNF